MAEDLTQGVFMKALGAFESYDPEISASAWIFTIARNHLINSLQKEKGNVPLEDIEQTLWDRVDLSDRMALSFDEKRLFEALSQIPADDAEIIRLKHLEGWEYEDIAQIKGKTSGALRIQVHRALKSLKAILKQK